MDAPVPCNVDEPREPTVFPRTDPAQTVPAHLRVPVIVQDPVPEALSMKDVQFGVRERAAPQVIDHRGNVTKQQCRPATGFPARDRGDQIELMAPPSTGIIAPVM